MPSDIVVLGSLNVDVVTRVAELPKPGETIIGLGLDLHAGGKGLNQAVGAARLGASVAMLGATGDDDGGRMLRSVLKDVSIDASGVVTISGQPTGQAHICVSAAGQNTIVVTSGANALLSLEHGVPATAKSARVALCQFETPHAALDAFLTATAGAVRIVNAAPAQPEWIGLFQQAEIVIVNETELMSYAGFPGGLIPDARSAIKLVRDRLLRSGQTVVVTLGAAGCVGITATEDVVMPGHKAAVVDTTGAGDCFCAALATAFAHGRSLRDALAFANKAAAIAVERHGASTSMPTLAEVEGRQF